MRLQRRFPPAQISLFGVTVLRSTGQLFSRVFLDSGCLDVHLMISVGLEGSGKKTTEVKGSFHPNIARGGDGLPGVSLVLG